MNVAWNIEDADVERVCKLMDVMKDRPFVKNRQGTEDRSMSPLTGLACLVASVPTVFTVGQRMTPLRGSARLGILASQG